MHDKYLFSTESHSAFSPNLIHGQITQISIDHITVSDLTPTLPTFSPKYDVATCNFDNCENSC